MSSSIIKRLTLIFLLPVAARANFYVITPGGTYTTFHSLIGSVTLAPGDIVEYQAPVPGGFQSFAEPQAITPNHSGALGNPITIRGRAGDYILIDGKYAIGNCVFINSTNYIVVQNLSFQNATGVGGISGQVEFNNTNGSSLLNCHINVGFADANTANTALFRCGLGQSGQNFTCTGNYILIGPGAWGSGECDAADIACSGTSNLIQYNYFGMHNSCYGPYGGLDSSTVVSNGGTPTYNRGDLLNVTSDLTTGTSSGSYGVIQVTGVTGGPPGTLATYTVITKGVNYHTGDTYATSASTGTGSGATIVVSNVAANHNDGLQLLNCYNTTVDSNIMDRNVTNSLTLGSGQALISEYYNAASNTSPTNYGYAIFTNNIMFGNYGSNGATINFRHESGQQQCGIVAITFSNNLIDVFPFVGNGTQSVPMNITSDAGSANLGYYGVWSGGTLVFQNNIIVNRNTSITIGGGISISAPYGSLSQAANLPNYPNIDYPGTVGVTLGSFTSDYNHVYYTSGVNGSSVQVSTLPPPTSRSLSNTFTPITWSQWVNPYGYDTHGIGYDTPGYSTTWQVPGFVNDSVQNYTLAQTSMDRGVGVANANTPVLDFNGRARPNNPCIGPSEAWVIGVSAHAGGHSIVVAGP